MTLSILKYNSNFVGKQIYNVNLGMHIKIQYTFVYIKIKDTFVGVSQMNHYHLRTIVMIRRFASRCYARPIPRRRYRT